MRILWSSNSPFAATGYGMQTATACARLQGMGHDMGIFAFYGLDGSKLDWFGMPIYPNPKHDWGVKLAPDFFKDFQADLLITLVDVWVLGDMDPTLPWCPWFPVDHTPCPPLIIKALKSPGIVKPIAMSKYGVMEVAKSGIDCYYIPHSVNTKLFSPDAEARKTGRERYKWQDKFVIGTVATNHSERKNWSTSFQAARILADRHPGEIRYYCHTHPGDERGINLVELRENLHLEEVVFFPSLAQMIIGIPRDVLARAYNVMDVFLLPSKGEGFGIPLVEAQACEVPVITTNCTAQPELVGGGWLINGLRKVWTGQGSWQFECDAEEVAERLEQAYQEWKDGSIQDKKTKAREKALEYDDDKVYAEYWPKVLDDIEKRLKQPKNLEGIQQWRLLFVPQSCVPRKVLDLGCGITQPYKKVLEHLGEYVGFDIKPGPDVVQGDAHNLPFKTKEFGFVWCSEMLEHARDPRQVVAEAKRVANHGIILFSTPANSNFRIDPDHKVVQGIKYSVVASGDGLISW